MDSYDIVNWVLGGMMILLLIGLILILFIGLPMIVWSSLEKECYKPQQLKLVSVNGMHDENTGLFTGGTVNQKTLLFDNGLVITKSSGSLQDLEIRIGKFYKVKKCINNGGLFK